jgi:hypothetical protein
MILFILQNAYTSDKHPFKNEVEWSRELLRSHTGRRLKEMIPDGVEYRVINASPAIGNNAKSCYDPDTEHIKTLVEQIKPDIICACGRMAQKGCKSLGYDFIETPHPAWRQLSKNKSNEIKEQILHKMIFLLGLDKNTIL